MFFASNPWRHATLVQAFGELLVHGLNWKLLSIPGESSVVLIHQSRLSSGACWRSVDIWIDESGVLDKSHEGWVDLPPAGVVTTAFM